MLPLFLVLAVVTMRTVGMRAAGELLLFGLVHPVAAGLDGARPVWYLNLAGLLFVCGAAWLLWNHRA